MPEVVSRLKPDLPAFPAGAGKGSVFTPLPQDIVKGKLRAHAVQTILAKPRDLYDLWHEFTLAPRWQEYVVSVEDKAPGISHWVLGDPEDPNGKRIEFDTEIVEDIPGEKLAWRSITEGVEEAGEVTFQETENGRGTLVTLQERFGLPGGALGSAVAGLIRRTPRQIVIESLRHFKQIAESGEIPSVVGQPHGPRGLIGGFKERVYGENNPTPAGTSVL